MTMRKRVLVLNPDYQECMEFVQSLPALFERQGDILHDGRNTVKRFDCQGRPLIVKRFKLPLWFQRIAYTFFRSTKARKAYEKAMRFLALGIDTPRPVAYIETTSSGLFDRGYFISEQDSRPSCDCFDDLGQEMDEQMVERLAEYILSLHRLGVLHGDLNLSNILYENRGEGVWHFALIDINRAVFVEGMPSYQQTVDDMWRITHTRALARRILLAYARLRGWGEEAFVEDVFARIRYQERQKRWRRKVLKRR